MYTIPSGATITFHSGTVEGSILVEDGGALTMNESTYTTVPVGKTLTIQGYTELNLIVRGTLIPKNCTLWDLRMGTSTVENESVSGVVKWESSSDILTLYGTLGAVDASNSAIDLSADFFDVSEAMGHLGVLPGVDTSDFEKDNLVAVVIGAYIASMEAHRSGDSELTVTATFGNYHETSYAYAVEKQTSGDWTLVDDSVSTNPKVLSTSIPYGQTWIRTFDGEAFLYDYIWSLLGTSMDVVSMCVENDEDANYFVLSKIVAPTAAVHAKQTVTILARICSSSDSTDVLLNDWEGNITSVAYTCYQITQSGSGVVKTAVTGHNAVSRTTDCVSDAVATSRHWTGSNFGYNFSLTPSTRTNDLFPEPGDYEIEVTIGWNDDEGTAQTPITFSNTVEVLI